MDPKVKMGDKERLQLNTMLKENDVVDQTELIRKLKHSAIFKKEVATLLNLKKKYPTDTEALNAEAMIECSFLFSYYTDLYNKIRKDEIDIKILYQFIEVLENITPKIPQNKPRYLMRVGTPSDILGAVKRGIDMFDCVLPTRSGRTGLAFTWNGRVNIRNSKYQNDDSPLDPAVKNLDLNKYSKSYLNHLFNTNEILGSMLLTLHNINFYQELMSLIRKNIRNGTFKEFHDKYIDKL